MKSNDKNILVCDCEGTMKLDTAALAKALGGDAPGVNTHLCRSQLENFTNTIKDGAPVLVCCTQEAPLFDEVAVEASPDTDISYVNIRETAGWSEQGASAMPKMAALIAEAALDLEPAQAVTLTSDGNAIVFGSGEVVLEAAKRLSARMNVTCVVQPGDDLSPPNLNDMAVFRGVAVTAAGHMGKFAITFKDFAATEPSSRGSLDFSDASAKDETLPADILVDLSGQPMLFAGGDRREGYLRADPGNPSGVMNVLKANVVKTNVVKPGAVKKQ